MTNKGVPPLRFRCSDGGMNAALNDYEFVPSPTQEETFHAYCKRAALPALFKCGDAEEGFHALKCLWCNSSPERRAEVIKEGICCGKKKFQE